MDWRCYKSRNTAKLEVVVIINLYSKTETNFYHNGLMVLQPIEAIVTEEINGDYSLKITMPCGFLEIENEQIIKAPTPKSDQLFRVYNSDVDMLGNPVFYARHIFYDLLDYFIEDTRPRGDGALAISKILEDTPFSGTSDITNQGTAYYQMMSPVKAILGADNSFIEVWGGEIERDNFSIRMKNRIGEDRGVSIRYRKNLTGLRLVTDLSGVYTKIMPTGLKEDGQALLKLPEKYVVSPLVDNYVNVKTTRIHYSNIKIGEETTEEQAFEKLRNAANLEFENGIDKPQITATVEFIPLLDTEEYKDFSILETIYLGDTVSIFHENLNIEMSAKAISYEFDALSKRYNKVILGNANPKYGDAQKQYVKQQNEETATALEQVIISTTQSITGNNGGYIVMHPAEKPQEILIMDTPDTNTAQRVWKWDLSRLSYSSSGVEGSFSPAITMDGAIVADFITAGKINGALIKTDTIEEKSLSQEYKNSVTDAINEKVSVGEISNQISDESGDISITDDRLAISSTYFTLNNNGKITCTNANVSGTFETNGDYGSTKLSDGRLTGEHNSVESGYISFNTSDGTPETRIAGANGVVISAPNFGVTDYLDAGSQGAFHQGQTGSQTFITNIKNNDDGTISWETKTINFTKGIMTTSL